MKHQNATEHRSDSVPGTRTELTEIVGYSIEAKAGKQQTVTLKMAGPVLVVHPEDASA